MTSEHHDAEREAAYGCWLAEAKPVVVFVPGRITEGQIEEIIRTAFEAGWTAREQHDKETEVA